jgi:hypothetical protein
MITAVRSIFFILVSTMTPPEDLPVEIELVADAQYVRQESNHIQLSRATTTTSPQEKDCSDISREKYFTKASFAVVLLLLFGSAYCSIGVTKGSWLILELHTPVLVLPCILLHATTVRFRRAAVLSANIIRGRILIISLTIEH